MREESFWISIVVSIAVSIASNKILAAHTFNVIDDYVKDLIEVAKKSIRDAYSDK